MEARLKRLIIIVLPITILVGIMFFGAMLGAGGNGYAEQYQFEVDTTTLIKTIKNFKSANESFNPPANFQLSDYLDTITTDYNVSLFIKNKNSVIAFYINGKGNKSIVNLVSVNQGFEPPVYKIINKDLSRRENLKVKEEFENVFLKKLKIPYKDKGNNMFVFWK